MSDWDIAGSLVIFYPNILAGLCLQAIILYKFFFLFFFVHYIYRKAILQQTITFFLTRCAKSFIFYISLLFAHLIFLYSKFRNSENTETYHKFYIQVQDRKVNIL